MKRNKDLTPPTDEINETNPVSLRKLFHNKLLLMCIISGLAAFILLIVFFSTILPLRNSVSSTGETIGEANGKVVGKVIGFVESRTSDMSEVKEEAERDGQSAKDTIVEISNDIEAHISTLGNLEVLVANVDLQTFHNSEEKYAAIYLTKANAVFTVSLDDVSVTHKEGLISIVVPKPTVEVRYDPSQTTKIADWHKQFFNGTDEDGFIGYMNSFADKIKNISANEIENYDALMALASDSAENQLRNIAMAVIGNQDIVIEVIQRG